ncbi:MAG: MFS transporter, partial [Gammaproteobacteria bacterium]
MMKSETQSEHKPRPLLDLVFSVVIPAFILMKLSGEAELGPVNALLLALAFPLGLGLYELIRFRKYNFISILGLVSVLLTGGIGLLELDAHWLAVKEAMIPGLIGSIVLIMSFTK